MRIGSSDIAAIVGLNKYKSALQLWAEKTGKVERDAENDKMWLGTRMQGVMCDYYARVSGFSVKESQALHTCAEYPWAVAVPDAISSENDGTIIEFKHKNFYARDSVLEGAISAPDFLQVAWQLNVCKCSHGRVVSMIEKELFISNIIEVGETAALFAALVEAAEKFLDFCKRDIPPEPTSIDAPILRRLYPVVPKTEVDLPLDLVPACHSYKSAAEQKRMLNVTLRELEEQQESAKVRLIAAMRGAEVGKCGKYEIKHTASTRKGYTVKDTEVHRFNLNILEAEDGEN